MKKHVYKVLVLLLSGIMLCGCNSDVPDLSEEQTAMITEYATNLLVKHSELSNRNLLSESELASGVQEEEEAKVRKVKENEIAEAYLNKGVEMIEGAMPDISSDASDAKAEDMVVSSQTISEFFAEDNFSIDYMSYELCQSYPEENAEDFFMAMDATPGHQLCIVKFQVQNISASDLEFDMLNKKGRFTLRTSEGETIHAQSTMLLDDLSSYRGTIAANASEEMVLVFEVEESMTQMDSMKLIMRDESGENVISLE